MMPSFVTNVAAVVDKLGTKMPGVVIGLALTDWESVEARDEFLNLITTKRQG